MESSSIITLLVIGIILSKMIIGVLIWHLVKKNRLLKQEKQLLAIKNEELAKAEEFKLKVLSIAAHDLRSPFIALRMLLESQHLGQFSQMDLQTLFSDLEKQINVSQQMVDDVLLWTAGQIKNVNQIKEIFNVSAMVSQTIALFQPQIKSREIEIKNNLSTAVHGEGNLDIFNFIVRNILHNAIKYSPEKGEIEIQLDLQDNMAKLSIRDRGQGMDEFKLQAVNAGIISSEKQKSGSGSMGLGLSLCHMLAKQADWKIFAESVSGQGCNISLSFPIRNNIESSNIGVVA